MRASARKRLLEFAETGRLRNLLMNGHTDADVVDLIVTVCLRYAEPRRSRRSSEAKARAEK